jgi:GMP synthase-like glutamine amidotransferase
MQRKKIIILQHIVSEGPGRLKSFFQQAARVSQIIHLYQGDPLPDSLEQMEAVIVLGGPMNVYEEQKYPFLKQEDIFIKKVLEKRIPFLGICLGAQLLAKAVGAKVKKAPVKEIGWYRIQLTPSGVADPLWVGFSHELTVFQWHEDTFDIPRKGVLMATSLTCPHQAFRMGPCAYGLQFHLEATPPMIKAWSAPFASSPDTKNISNIIRKGLRDENNGVRKHAHMLFLNFLRVIEKG